MMEALVRYRDKAQEAAGELEELDSIRKSEVRLKVVLTALLSINLACVSGAITLGALLLKETMLK